MDRGCTYQEGADDALVTSAGSHDHTLNHTIKPHDSSRLLYL
jgi:hypothetical protein